MRRAHLAGVLADAVTASSGIEMLLGAEVVRAAPDGAVTYRTGDDERTLEAALVVAADGVRSCVRETVGFAATLQDTTHTYLRAIVDHEDSDADAAEQGEHWTPLGLFGSSPLGDGTTYFFSDADAPRCAARSSDATSRSSVRRGPTRSPSPVRSSPASRASTTSS